MWLALSVLLCIFAFVPFTQAGPWQEIEGDIARTSNTPLVAKPPKAAWTYDIHLFINSISIKDFLSSLLGPLTITLYTDSVVSSSGQGIASSQTTTGSTSLGRRSPLTR